MVRRRSRGFSLLELVVALAVFGGLILILTILQAEMMKHGSSARIRLMTHPEPASLLARLRTDVLDAQGYRGSVDGFTQNETTLLLSMISPDADPRSVVYDFGDDGMVHRYDYRAEERISEWTARGLPRFEVSSYDMPDGQVAARIQAWDNGRLVIDEILEPRKK